MSYLASIPPGEINTHNIAQALKIDHKTAFHYLTILEAVGLARFIYSFQGGNRLFGKATENFSQ